MRASSIAHTLEVGGQRVTAERIVIATGGHPVRPDIPGAELGIVSDDAFFLPAMPKRVAIVGGGYIAVEFAGIFAGLGAETHLVYRQPLPLRGFDQDLRDGPRRGAGRAGHHAASGLRADVARGGRRRARPAHWARATA